MTLRFRPITLIGAIVLALSAATAPASAAIEVHCVEASRYKHLYRIFNNDPARFAAFLGVDSRRLPNPEACRALLVSGRIDPSKRGGGENDFDRLLNAIASGNGWVSTLYLSSPGGNVAMGMRLGQITRMMWLSTHAIDAAHFEYVPDFLSSEGPGSPAQEIPPDLQNGWRDYQAATQGFIRTSTANREKQRPGRCVSACTYMLAAGVHRYGQGYFHRGRRGTPREPDAKPGPARSMSDSVDHLQKVEEWIVAFYRAMDVGEEGIQAFKSTATQETLRAYVPEFPRYVSDQLAGVCRVPRRPRSARDSESAITPAEQTTIGAPLTAQSEQTTLNPPLPGDPPRSEPPPSQPPQSGAPPSDPPQGRRQRSQQPRDPEQRRTQRSQPADLATLRCFATNHMRERLIQFSKLCPSGCDRSSLFRDVTERTDKLRPEGMKQSRRDDPSQPRRQRSSRQGGSPSGGYPPQGPPPRSYPPPYGSPSR